MLSKYGAHKIALVWVCLICSTLGIAHAIAQQAGPEPKDMMVIGQSLWFSAGSARLLDVTAFAVGVPNRILSGTEAGFVRLYEIDSQKLIFESRPTTRSIKNLAFSGTQHAVAVLDDDTVLVLNLSDGAEVRRFPIEPCSANRVWNDLNIVQATDKMLLTVCDGAITTLRIWSMSDGTLLQSRDISSFITAVLSPDSSQVAWMGYQEMEPSAQQKEKESGEDGNGETDQNTWGGGYAVFLAPTSDLQKAAMLKCGIGPLSITLDIEDGEDLPSNALLAFSPDAKTLVSASSSGTLQVCAWPVSNGEGFNPSTGIEEAVYKDQPVIMDVEHKPFINAMLFSEDGSLLNVSVSSVAFFGRDLSYGEDNQYIFNVQTGEMQMGEKVTEKTLQAIPWSPNHHSTLIQKAYPARGLIQKIYSPDHYAIPTSSTVQLMRAFDASPFTPSRDIIFPTTAILLGIPHHAQTITKLIANHDGSSLVTQDTEGTTIHSFPQTPHLPRLYTSNPDDACSESDFDGTLFITPSHDLFVLRGFACLASSYEYGCTNATSESHYLRINLSQNTSQNIPSDPTESIRALAQLPDGHLLVCNEWHEQTESFDDCPQYNQSYGRIERRTSDLSKPTILAEGFDFCPRAQGLSAASMRAIVVNQPFPYENWDSKTNKTTTSTPTARILDIHTQKTLLTLPAGTSQKNTALSPNGKYAAVSLENVIQVFEVDSGKVIFTHTGNILLFSPDSRVLLFNDNKKLTAINITNPDKILHLDIHATVLTFSGDVKTLFVANADNEIYVWDWPTLAKGL